MNYLNKTSPCLVNWCVRCNFFHSQRTLSAFKKKVGVRQHFEVCSNFLSNVSGYSVTALIGRRKISFLWRFPDPTSRDGCQQESVLYNTMSYYYYTVLLEVCARVNNGVHRRTIRFEIFECVLSNRKWPEILQCSILSALRGFGCSLITSCVYITQ